MDKIKKYIKRFFINKEVNDRYDINTRELRQLADDAIRGGSVVNTIATTFEYGYAKGYRAAISELKKGGAA